MAVSELKGKINVADKIVGNITKQSEKITGSVSKPVITKPLSAREGVVTLIMLGTAYAPSGIASNIKEA